MALPGTDPSVENLLRWLERGGGWSSRIQIVSPEGGERGVRALGDIAPEETIIRIPRQYVLTLKDARASEIGRLLEAHAQLDDLRTCMAAFLLQERERGEASFWKPFLDTLPKSFPTHPFFFDAREGALLRGSFLEGMLQAQRETFAARYAHLSECVPGFNRFSFDDYTWAHFAVVSRTFSMLENGEVLPCMVPLAEMLNDGRPWDTRWAWSEETQHFEVKALNPVAAGREVQTTYGEKGNLHLLLQYGFVHEDNPHDNVVVFLGLSLEDPLAARKQQLLGIERLTAQGIFKLMLPSDQKAMAELFSFLRVVHADAEDVARLEAAPDPRVRARSMLSMSNEQKLIPAFLDACQERLAGYETSLEEDERMLREEPLSFNARNCIVLRRGEKRILDFHARSYSDMARSGALPDSLNTAG